MIFLWLEFSGELVGADVQSIVHEEVGPNCPNCLQSANQARGAPMPRARGLCVAKFYSDRTLSGHTKGCNRSFCPWHAPPGIRISDF